MEEPGGLQSMGSLESDTTERLHFHFSISCIGEGNGNPLQCSCLENPREGKPVWLPSMGLHRVGHDWSDAAAAACHITHYVCIRDDLQHAWKVSKYGSSSFSYLVCLSTPTSWGSPGTQRTVLWFFLTYICFWPLTTKCYFLILLQSVLL